MILDINNIDIKNIYETEKKDVISKIFMSKEFEDKYKYDGNLGAIYSKEKTTFKLWSPVASKVILELFNKERNKDKFEKLDTILMKEEDGIWIGEKLGDLDGVYYRYIVHIGDNTNIACDPYAKAVSANGEYSMVIDLNKTNPNDWNTDKKPVLKSYVDSIIYEMHIRDFSIDEKSGIKEKGKYNGVWKRKCKLKNSNLSTGIDHLIELGVTHVHLLPTFDYKSVDEKNLERPQYNWGYDPENYNCPEGSYSNNPFDGEFRIKEFKNMVLNLHKEGLRVVMDVVYNHTFEGENSLFNKIVPYYYYRENENGEFSNGSACGNETASDRIMFRKFMVDSVVYWAKEYHIDGFRFDLMGLHDIETMKQIRRELDKIDPSIIMYGEGWTGGDTPLKEDDRALKKNTVKYGEMQIAAFSDDIRDGVKGDVFVGESKGFANGGNDFEETIKCGIVASINHKDIDYSKVIYSDSFWANEPYQTVTYDSAHDNYTLWDKLKITCDDESEEERIKMNKLIAAIVLTSQGISFLHSGEEFLRTKEDEDGKLIENSYNSSDYVNRLDWSRKEKYKEVFDYYKGLINLRKNHKAFRMDKAEDIRNNLSFLEVENKNVVAYRLNGQAVGDKFKEIIVIFNGNKEEIHIKIPNDDYKLILNGEEVNMEGIESIKGDNIKVPGRSPYLLAKF